jgi:hypothetical protein
VRDALPSAFVKFRKQNIVLYRIVVE